MVIQFLLLELGLHALLPFTTHLFDPLLVVERGVIRLSDTTHTLPQRQMLGMNGNAVVVLIATGADVGPTTFLLLEIKTSGVRHEEHVDENTSETKPRNNPESRLCRPVAVTNSGRQGAQLADSSGETVSSSTDGHGVDFGGGKEGDAVGSELLKEGREEVHSLELLDVGLGGVILELRARNDEEEEVHEEPESHHVLATIEFVVDQETCEVVAAKGDTNVDQVVEPAGHDRSGAGTDDLDELALKQLVAVEEDIIHIPGTGSGDDTATEVVERQLERLGIVTGDGILLLGKSKLSVGIGLDLEGTEVNEP